MVKKLEIFIPLVLVLCCFQFHHAYSKCDVGNNYQVVNRILAHPDSLINFAVDSNIVFYKYLLLDSTGIIFYQNYIINNVRKDYIIECAENAQVMDLNTMKLVEVHRIKVINSTTHKFLNFIFLKDKNGIWKLSEIHNYDYMPQTDE